MPRSTMESYASAVEKLKAACSDLLLSGDIEAAYIGGSVARGDFVPGRSDIDVYVVCKVTTANVHCKLAPIVDQIANRWLPDLFQIVPQPISLALTSMDDIHQGKTFLGAGFEYHNFLNTGKLIVGHDVRHLLVKPTREQELILAKQTIESSNREILEKIEASESIPSESQLYAFFSTAFRCAAIFLCAKGQYVAAKKETVETFHRLYGKSQKSLCTALRALYDFWLQWAQKPLESEDRTKVEDLCKEFVLGVTNMVRAKIHDQETR